jgi:hypothetical protein
LTEQQPPKERLTYFLDRVTGNESAVMDLTAVFIDMKAQRLVSSLTSLVGLHREVIDNLKLCQRHIRGVIAHTANYLHI